MVRLLIKFNASIESLDRASLTPLFMTISGNSLYLFKYFSEELKANVFHLGRKKVNIAFWATTVSLLGENKVLDYIYEKYSYMLDEKTSQGWNCLNKAVWNGDLKLVTKILAEKKVGF